jgi:hypothetical protein
MVEMRWFVNSDFVKVLQYRQKVGTSVAGELFDVVWSEWIDVPTVEEGK